MANLERIKDQLVWGKENLDSPQDNLSLEDVEWIIEQAEKVERLEEYIGELEQNKPKLETINSIRKKHGFEALEEKS